MSYRILIDLKYYRGISDQTKKRYHFSPMLNNRAGKFDPELFKWLRDHKGFIYAYSFDHNGRRKVMEEFRDLDDKLKASQFPGGRYLYAYFSDKGKAMLYKLTW